ncbi:FtsX-like permease family protein [Micromonospora sp. NBC_00617]|uniref:FtsX-like permease family protein n=1 Tax=Micromonospora sp. NBC_00617 TaxID=2903587 RepID=UPI0030E12994
MGIHLLAVAAPQEYDPASLTPDEQAYLDQVATWSAEDGGYQHQQNTRESATLRAIGLSKEQLRGMLAVEGVLIAGIGPILGIVLGLVFGWAGAVTALSLMGDVRYTVPWTDLAAVLAIALLAGLLASVLPARAAARASPVAALGAE